MIGEACRCRTSTPGSSALREAPTIPRHLLSAEIDAPPEVVWGHVISFSELPPPEEWIFRAGIAYPIRAEIQGSGPGAVRTCVFSTGAFVEPIEVWSEPVLLRFTVTRTRTLLAGTTWYRHDLRPAFYWRMWSDAILHRIHLRVLRHIKRLSEQEVRP